VAENVLAAGYNSRKFSAAMVKERTETLLFRMGIAETNDRFPGQVSGGEAQRAAIARAVINEPDLLFGRTLLSAGVLADSCSWTTRLSSLL